MRNLVLFTSMILSFWGCSNDKDFGGLENIGWNEKPLQITTRILTTKSTNFIQELKEGSMLGLQITSVQSTIYTMAYPLIKRKRKSL